MFKKTFFQIHWFLGITAGLVLSIMGITGAIYSYEQQIQKWLNPASYTVTVENSTKLSPSEIYQHFQRIDPGLKINSITIDKNPEASSSINIVKEGARRGYNMMINPYTAEVLPDIQGRDFFQFIQQLHRYLTVGDVGKQITGASTLMLIFFVLSGVYLRWPKKHTWKQWFAVKPKLKGRNFIWDLHAVIGTWLVAFYLTFACTGLYWSYDWWRSGMFKVLGVTAPQSQNKAATNPATEKSAQAGANNATRGNPNNKQLNLEKQHSATDAQLNADQIKTALQSTWIGFNSQIGRDYSTLTLSLPKKADGMMELSFVDAIPQHERARNKANYNYQINQLQDIELYQDKKLNEKIMGSMLPVHRGSFFGPVVQFMFMLAALTMPLFFVTGWMLYLKRRKQKRLALAARTASPMTHIDPNAKPWLVTYASQTGVAEQLAWRTSTRLQEAHQPVVVKPIQHLTEDDFQQNQQILLVLSTYGTGQAPDLASTFEKKMLKMKCNLSHISYAVLALGSKEYPDSYCHFGHRVDAWMQRKGAQRLFNTIEVNNGSDHDIQQWNSALVQATQLELNDMSIEKVFDCWQLQQRSLLNPNSLGAPTYNIELETKHDVSWQAGDIAEVQPGNSTERIAEFLKQHALDAKAPVPNQQCNLQQWLWDRDLTVQCKPNNHLDQFLAQLPPLPTREYSIASIPEQQRLRLVIRQQVNQLGEVGLGSGWMTQHVQLYDAVQLRIRSNRSFHLIDDNRPIICIGNGTGIAGLMSLIYARAEAGYGENWLIFGERQRAHDYFYQGTLEAWKNTGVLKRLDLAFSRDQADKVYVHHLLRQQAERLKQWIDNEAIIYVCGSMLTMARDVDNALIDILGEAVVDQLRQAGRYRRDVY